jgi:hypothetical protein
MSFVFILSIASITRFAFALSCPASNVNHIVGAICHESPNLSVSHSHCDSCPPPAVSFCE